MNSTYTNKVEEFQNRKTKKRKEKRKRKERRKNWKPSVSPWEKTYVLRHGCRPPQSKPSVHLQGQT